MTTFHIWSERTGRVSSPDWVVEADRIEFQPGFVVFRNNDYRVLEVFPEAFVQDLLQLPELCPALDCTFRHEGGLHSFETPCDSKYMPSGLGGQAVPIRCTKMAHPDWVAHSWITELPPEVRLQYEVHIEGLLQERERTGA